jgi:hypothetical protein
MLAVNGTVILLRNAGPPSSTRPEQRNREFKTSRGLRDWMRKVSPRIAAKAIRGVLSGARRSDSLLELPRTQRQVETR